MSLSVPSTFDIAVTDSSFAPSSRRSSSVTSSWKSSVIGIQRRSIPRSSTRMCHGTTLAWCSIAVMTTGSPGPRFLRAHEWARRFIASVMFFVNTISPVARALRSSAIFARAPSYAAVDSSAMV